MVKYSNLAEINGLCAQLEKAKDKIQLTKEWNATQKAVREKNSIVDRLQALGVLLDQ